MTEITNSVEKDISGGLPYKFRCRWFGKYDEEFNGVSPVGLNKSESDLTAYDGLDYYKEPYISLNATTVGSPTIIDESPAIFGDFEVSGFSTSKYLTIPPTFSSANSWKIVLRFKSSSASATGHFFSSMAGVAGQYAGVDISLDSGKLKLQLGMGGSSFQTIVASSAVAANTWYFVKATFSYDTNAGNGTYEFSYSADGTTYTTIGSLTGQAKVVNSNVTRIGVYGNKVEGAASTVTVDMENCYVMLNNETAWRGTYLQGTMIDFSGTVLPWKWGYQSLLKKSKYAVGLQNQSYSFYGNTLNGTITGAPSISPDRLMSGFSQDNYLTIISQWKPFDNPWKIHLKITTGATDNTTKYLFGQPTTNYTTPQLDLVSKSLKLYLSANMQSWDIASGETCSIDLEPNTTYDVDVEFTGTAYTVSVDGVVGLTVTTSTATFSGTYPLILGFDKGNNGFNGSIDLGESYVTVNGEEVWRGFSKHTYDGCINGDTDSNGEYYCYAINGDDHVELRKKTGSTILAYNTNPRYLDEVDVNIIHIYPIDITPSPV